MEENISLQQKLGNAMTNIRMMMSSDKRVLFAMIGVGVLVLVFIVLAVMSFSSSSKSSTVTTQTPSGFSSLLHQRSSSVIKQKIPATLSLVLSDTKKVYKVGDTITFSIVGDSAGAQVKGYDAVFKFDSGKVQFVSEKNLYPLFPYRRRILGNWVIITGVQPFSKTTKNIFSKTPLMGITFKATAPGVAYFPVSYIPDSTNDSNLIDTASNDMLSSATGIVVQIFP